MKNNTNIILGGACVILAGACAILTAKLIKTKNYIDITEACLGDHDEFFEDDESEDEA